MNCEQALILLSGHLDGQNTQEEELVLQAHLEVCAECRALLDTFTAVDQGVAALEAEPPAALLSGVMERIKSAPPMGAQPKKHRFFFGPGTAVAAVAAVLLLVLGTGNLQNLQLGRASVAQPEGATAAQDQIAEPTVQNDETGATMASPAAIDAPMAVTAAPTQQPHADASLISPQSGEAAPAEQTSPKPRSADLTMETAQVKLIITENPERPAQTTIAELATLTMEVDEAGFLYGVSDVKTAKDILAAYNGQYTMELVEPQQTQADTAPCTIYLVQP